MNTIGTHPQPPAGFPLDQINRTINAKKEIYYGIAAKTHKVDDDTAIKIMESELETYLSRLKEYWDDPMNHKSGTPTLTERQGINIFLEVLQSGLSFSKTAHHIYLSRLKGTGTAVGYQPTADGLVYRAQKAGAIDHLSEPVLVQLGEEFSIRNTDQGKHVAQHVARFDGRPAFSFDNFLVGYIYIVYPNGDRELSWISKNRLAEYRAKSPSKYLYNDESFIQTKVIKHALRKVRKTDFMMQLQAEDDEVVQENMEWSSTTGSAMPTPAPAASLKREVSSASAVNAPAQTGWQNPNAGAFFNPPIQNPSPTKGNGSFNPAPEASQQEACSNSGVGDEPF